MDEVVGVASMVGVDRSYARLFKVIKSNDYEHVCIRTFQVI